MLHACGQGLAMIMAPLGLGGDASVQLWTAKQCDAVDALQSTVCVAPHSCSELPNRSIVRTYVRRNNLVVGTLGLEPVSLYRHSRSVIVTLRPRTAVFPRHSSLG